MANLGKKIEQFLKNDSGATTIEYGLITALMAVAAIVSFVALSNGLQNIFGTTNSGAGTAINDAASSL